MFPEFDGIIEGPPCQSWSETMSLKALMIQEGNYFISTHILKDKKPKFFLTENVKGMMTKRHNIAVENIVSQFEKAGYDAFIHLLIASDYIVCVPQNRKKVFYVGFRKNLNIEFEPFKPYESKVTFKNAIFDLKDSVIPSLEK
ncbi:DNA cytosine methyltransferase [Enterococcus cecorum]|nr:DNA cytosine methyltransferase [Enterococcus cecorum]OJG32328.1 hypothetical protein RT42_GL000462 [Enterococcus cecorum DSM 20682 = ATCC 43198]